jgi:O-antigen/teichoic acid export membrane protein
LNPIANIARNIASLLLSRLLNIGIGFFFWVFAARMLGGAAYGRFLYVTALVGIVAVIADFGLDNLVVREVAKDKTQGGKYLGNVLITKFLLSLLVMISVYIFALMKHSPRETSLALTIWVSSILFSSTKKTLWAYSDAFEHIEYRAILSIIVDVFKTGLGLLVLLNGLGVIPLIMVCFLAEIVGVIVSFALVTKRFGAPDWKFDLEFSKSLMSLAYPFVLLGLLSMIYLRIDILMLEWMKGDEASGWYGSAYKIIEALMFVSESFMISLFPVMSRFYKTSKDSLYRVYEKSFTYLLILGLPLAMGVSILADRFILLIYKEEYINSIPVLRILIWSLALTFINAPYGRILIVINRQLEWLLVGAINTVLNIALNLILIPRFSYVGAGVATLITEFTGFMLLYYLVSRYLYRINPLKLSWKPILSVLVMGAYLYGLREASLWILIPTSAIIYVVTLTLLKGLGEDDLSIFRRALAFNRERVV